MTTIKKTVKDLLDIDAIVGNLYEQSPELKNSKFAYAYKRFFALNLEPATKDLNEKIVDINVDNALEDKETKELLKDDRGNYKYSKEGQKNLIKARRKVQKDYESKEIDVKPFISTYVPVLTEEEEEILTGLLIEKKK